MPRLDLAAPVPLEGIHPVTDWSWAQARTNFVVVTPQSAPGWKVVDPTVRGESAAAFSTVRYHLEDGAGRRLRVKQNCNDWWIPTVCDISFRKPGTPLVVGDDVAYRGRDYKRHEGACFHRYGTQVELSLETGVLEPQAWAALIEAFDAVRPEAVARARATPFARRNYWNRWNRTEAPWDTREISSLAWTEPTTAAMERAAWALTADRWASVPGSIDSLGLGTGPDGDEVQLAFRWPMSLNCSAWIRALSSPRRPWRSLIDQSEVNRRAWEEVRMGGQVARRASMDPATGNWYYAWETRAGAYELHLRARPGLDARAADAVVRGLVA